MQWCRQAPCGWYLHQRRERLPQGAGNQRLCCQAQVRANPKRVGLSFVSPPPPAVKRPVSDPGDRRANHLLSPSYPAAFLPDFSKIKKKKSPKLFSCVDFCHFVEWNLQKKWTNHDFSWFSRRDPPRIVFTLCSCVRTQTGQAGWSVQQETCRRKLHQRRQQGPGLHGGQAILTVGHDLQAFQWEVIRRRLHTYLHRMHLSWLFSLFFAVRRDKKSSEELPSLSAALKEAILRRNWKPYWSACFVVNVFFLLKTSCFPM